MNERNKKSNIKHTMKNSQGRYNKDKRQREKTDKNQLKENSENNHFDFTSVRQQIQHSSSSNSQNHWKIELDLPKNNLDNKINDKQQSKTNKLLFGFKRLEDLCNKDVSEILFVMANKNNGFMDLFKQNKDPDWIFLLMKISSKICSTDFIQSKTYLLTELTCNEFFDHLKTYILSTPTEKNGIRCNNMNEFFDNCLIVFEFITTLFPKTAVEKLRDLVVSSNIALTGIKNYCNNIKISENMLLKMEELLQKLNDIKLTDEVKLKEKLTFQNIAQLMPPPENFRELTVYPTAIDLEFRKPFLRPNILKGAYQNVDHYLDVQFRLLREDFIAPLRDGIRFYKELINNREQQRKKKINNIRIYNNVTFEERGKFVYDKSGYLINFNNNNKIKINWEMAKRFMYGSLLLFTVDEFRTFFLGVVLERKVELLKQGKLIVELLEDAQPFFKTSMTMVESEVFFEPYKCSMEVLKTINNHNFPMEKYIVSACNKVDYPYYIDTLPDQYYSVDNLKKFQVLYNEQWPDKEQLGLDEMQYSAFKAALTSEFTVIQGPPGTGKTYIGLKIMKTIIDNLYMNTTKRIVKKPILVICYTNHALDQFTEGILSFTNKVVRIGGQSKSEVLESYSLRNITRIHRRSFCTNKGLNNVFNEMKNVMKEIKYLKECSEFILHNAGVLELSLLKNGMPKRYHYYFDTSLDLISWLFQDLNYFNIDPVIFLRRINFGLINNTHYHSENILEVKNEIKDDINEQYEADDPDLVCNYNNNILIYSLSLNAVKKTCREQLSECISLQELSNSNINYFNEYGEANFNLSIMEKIHDYFTDMLSLNNNAYYLPKIINDLNLLNMKQRWTLYFNWVKKTKEMFDFKIESYEEKYNQHYKQYAELKELENIEILNKMNVIALTTTGAAKHRTMIEGLESPIVVVEEAAEVLEAHIISSLTRHCQHLILIGDHKQLRPSNAVYSLAKDYGFDISLFERMVNNNVPCYTLGEQHRMRPEIASLITPTIYPELKNHISVHNREHIRGVNKDLFFLNHNIYEKEVEEISSKSNDHEASFLILFARHLLLQGYKTNQVTILTTYSGQLFLLRSLRKKHKILEGIQIKVVDNYQGEESDIILLSLVRSNEKGNVGFLKTENRICVALSRAKYGLYIMGNMDNLCNSANLWKQIKETLDNKGSYGNELTLECAIHSGITMKVSKGEDFNIIMEGGCTMLCKSLLLCGHYCTSICHSYDREHLEHKCQEPCNRSCDYNHQCLKLCFMDCGNCNVPTLKNLPCGHQLTLPCYVDTVIYLCNEKVEVTLEECGHTIIKECHDKKPKCTFKCFDRLDCGHACEKNCHVNDDPDHEKYKCLKPCENVNNKCSLNHKCQKLCHEDCLDCVVKVDKILPCGHLTKSVPCGLKSSEVKCNKPCERNLVCNHRCQAKCYEDCKACEIQVKKIIPDCGHLITVKCKIEPKRKFCTQKCNRELDCGHKCKSKCAIECSFKECKEVVLQKLSKLACGHNNVWVLCCDKDKEFRMESQYLLDKCHEPCQQKLSCNDICQGTCGQCKQGRIHVPCNEKCNKINPCNHICKSPCKERCPPCNQKCSYSCVHSKCTKNCGNPCVKCQEKCEWNCPHLKCTKKCHEICNRDPCYEPCKLKLLCGHDCIGYCGEPCPPICRICQKNEVTTIIFGYEDEPEARFVYLEDCKHSIESTALEKWMNQNDEEIILKQCPICKVPILKTQRFMNQVKIILEDISKIKTKQFGELSVIKSYKKTILTSLKLLDNTFDSKFIGGNTFNHVKNLWDKFCKPLVNSLSSKNKYDTLYLPSKDIESLDFVTGLFKSISKYKIQINNIKDHQMKQNIIDHFVWLLTVAFTYAQKLSMQQKLDINMEMIRGSRILNLYEIKSNKEYKMKVMVQTSYAKELKDLTDNMEVLLMSCKIYSTDMDKEIQSLVELIQQKLDSITIITDDERKMINTAMSTSFMDGTRSQGHWCKCPNGHIYCITECGGPMQNAVCPECKAPIGGQGHVHVSGVTVASEMDGASRLRYHNLQNAN